MEINSLPNELFTFHILRELSFSELAKFARTNSLYKHLVDKELLRRLDTDNFHATYFVKHNLTQLRNIGKNSPLIRYYLICEIRVRLNRNMFLKIRQDYPTYPWFYFTLSKNRNVDLDYALRHPNRAWNFKALARNPNVFPQDFVTHSTTLSYTTDILYNPNFTYADITPLNPIIGPWHGHVLLSTEVMNKMTFKELMDNRWLLNFSRHNTLNNPHVTLGDIFSLPRTNKDISRCHPQNILLQGMNRNPNVIAYDCMKFPNLFYLTGNNPNMTFSDLLYLSQYDRNIFSNINMLWISENPNITIQDVLNNPRLAWKFDRLFANPGIEIEDIMNNKSFFKVGKYATDLQEWQKLLSHILQNPNFNSHHLTKYPEISWDSIKASENDFTRDPVYVRKANRIILEMLPETMDFIVNDVEVKMTKTQVYGLFVGLEYTNMLDRYRIKLVISTPYNSHTTQIISLKLAKRMFYDNNPHHRFYVKIFGKVYWFVNLDFLQGLKTCNAKIDDNVMFDRTTYGFTPINL